MLKKSISLLVIFLLLLPSIALASISSKYIASHGYDYEYDAYGMMWTSSISEVSYITYKNLDTGAYRAKYDESQSPGVMFRCNANFEWTYHASNGEVLATDSVNVTQVKEPNTTGICGEVTEQPTDPPPEPEPECEACALLSCPGWGDYMGKIDEIIGAIPPPPDWDSIAKTFRDTILTKWKSDMRELIGTPGQKPTAPTQKKPSGNLDKPTGQKAPGFDDSGFSADDIKNSAPVIEQREDPTGGFELLNPIDNLPTQDEFKDNIPNEPGENLAPSVPDVPEDNTAPKPPDQENPMPGEPEEKTDTAPTPPGGDNFAPGGPVEPENPMPGAPTDNTDTAPLPQEGDNTSPKPTEPENPAPTPGDNGGTAPLPGDGGGTAPIPGDTDSGYPIPPPDGSTAPTP